MSERAHPSHPGGIHLSSRREESASPLRKAVRAGGESNANTVRQVGQQPVGDAGDGVLFLEDDGAAQKPGSNASREGYVSPGADHRVRLQPRHDMQCPQDRDQQPAVPVQVSWVQGSRGGFRALRMGWGWEVT